MAQWVCNPCTAAFLVGLPRCPEPSCGARDAHEDGLDPGVNVYDAVEATGITDPADAWSAVAEAVAVGRGELLRGGRDVKTFDAAVAAVLDNMGEALAVPVAGETVLVGDGTGEAMPEAPESVPAPRGKK